MKRVFGVSDEEKAMRSVLRQHEAPDMTALQEQKLRVLLSEELDKKRLTPAPGMWRHMWRLARFISPSVWILQAVFLLLVIWVSGRQTEEWYLWNLSAMIPFLGVICVPELTKSFSLGMWELEQSCCFNLRKLMVAKMAVLGTVDGVFLIFLMAAVGSRGTGFTEAVLALLLPFQVSNAVYLGLFQVLKRHCSGYVLTAAGIFMAGGILMLRQYLPELPVTVSAGMAAGIGIAGFVLLLVSGYGVIKQMDREETVIWNFG